MAGLASNPGKYFLWISAHSPLPHIDRGPVVVAAVSAVIFTVIVYISSFITAACLGLFEQGVSEDSYVFSYYIYPIETLRDLVSSTLSILNDEFGIIDRPEGLHHPVPLIAKPDSFVVRLVKKFVLGLPLVGIGSLIQMVLSMPILGPIQWLARYRSSRGRRGSTRDMTAIVVVGLMVIGAIRFIYHISTLKPTIVLKYTIPSIFYRALAKVYNFTQKLTRRLLLRAEDIILEVS